MKFKNYSNQELIYYKILFIFLCSSAMSVVFNTLNFFLNLAMYTLKYGGLILGGYLIVSLTYTLVKRYNENKDKHFYISISLFSLSIILFIISIYFNIILFMV